MKSIDCQIFPINHSKKQEVLPNWLTTEQRQRLCEDKGRARQALLNPAKDANDPTLSNLANDLNRRFDLALIVHVHTVAHTAAQLPQNCPIVAPKPKLARPGCLYQLLPVCQYTSQVLGLANTNWPLQHKIWGQITFDLYSTHKQDLTDIVYLKQLI